MRIRSVSALASATLVSLALTACNNPPPGAPPKGPAGPVMKEPERTSAWTATYPHNAASEGKALYDRFCTACHGAPPPPPPPGADGPPPGGPMGGPSIPPGTAELMVKYAGDVPGELEKRNDLSAQTVIQFVRKGTGVMPAIRKTELSDEDLKTIADYLAKNP